MSYYYFCKEIEKGKRVPLLLFSLYFSFKSAHSAVDVCAICYECGLRTGIKWKYIFTDFYIGNAIKCDVTLGKRKKPGKKAATVENRSSSSLSAHSTTRRKKGT